MMLIHKVMHSGKGGFLVTVEGGGVLQVPDSLANRHRKAIAEWEASGGVVAPHVASAPTVDDVKSECSRRIFAVADAVTQTNISAVTALAAGKLEVDRTMDEAAHIAAHAAGLVWIDAMRANVQTVVVASLDMHVDANWPVCPAEVVILAERY